MSKEFLHALPTHPCQKRWWKFKWMSHWWDEIDVFVYPGYSGEARITQKCRRCGEVEHHDRPGGP